MIRLMTPQTATGYKGHRTGTLAAKAHKLVDDSPKAERKELITKMVKLGVSKNTAGHWVSVFKNWEPKKKAVAAKPAGKKPVATPTAKKKKGSTIVPKTTKKRNSTPTVTATPTPEAASTTA